MHYTIYFHEVQHRWSKLPRFVYLRTQTPKNEPNRKLNFLYYSGILSFLYNVFKTDHPPFTFILNIENIILWLWTASKGIWSISKGFDAILTRENPQSFLKKRLISVLHFIILNIKTIYSTDTFLQQS